MSSTLRQAISTPPSTSNPPVEPRPHSAEQASKISNLVAYYSDEGYKVGSGAAAGGGSGGGVASQDGGLTEDEKIFLSRETLARFLTAVKWEERAARSRLDKCLAWRRSMGVYDLRGTMEEVAPESPAGKEYVIGYTSKSQPILHFLPNRSTTETSDRQFKHAIYMIERTCDLFPPGVQTLLLLIDFSGKRAAPTSPAMAQRFISSLQNHYPERLGKGVLLDIPWIVKQFIDGVSYFMDPVTKQKVATNIKIVDTGVAPKEGATKDYGGQIEFAYEHEVYWPMLLEICLERREQNRLRWRELGGRVGLSEWEFKRAAPAGVGEGAAHEVLTVPGRETTSESLAIPRPSTGTDRSFGTSSFHTAQQPPTPTSDAQTKLLDPNVPNNPSSPSPEETARSSPTNSVTASDAHSRTESSAMTLHEGFGGSELQIGGGGGGGGGGVDGQTVKPAIVTIHEHEVPPSAPTALAMPV